MTEELPDIGLSTADCQSIKISVLKAVTEGHAGPGDAENLAIDLIEAFKKVDEQATIRDSISGPLTQVRK